MRRPDFEQIESWIREYIIPHRPELEEPFRAAFEGFKRITSSKVVDQEALDAIIHATSSKSLILADNSITFLIDLVPEFEEVREAVIRMYADKKMHVRFNALRSLSSKAPRNFSMSLLKRGLNDNSYKVRKFASHKIRTLRMEELIPIMEETLLREENPDAKSEINYNLRLLRDGYCLRNFGHQGLYLWIQTQDGVHGNKLSIKNIPNFIRLIPKMMKRNES